MAIFLGDLDLAVEVVRVVKFGPAKNIATRDTIDLWHQHYGPIRRHPVFKEVMVAIGLDEYWRARGFPPKCRALGDDDFECE